MAEGSGERQDLPAIVDGKFFTIASRSNKKITVKCMLCPNKLLTAQIDSTSNLLKQLKVCLCLVMFDHKMLSSVKSHRILEYSFAILREKPYH